MKRLLLILFLIPFAISSVFGQAVEVRVADIGAGLGTVTKLPNGKIMVYDAGRYTRLLPTLREMVPNKVIDLMVLSHNDADHIGAVSAILSIYEVKSLVFSEYRGVVCESDSEETYCKMMDAISKAENRGTKVTRVTNTSPAPETVLFNEDGVKITYLCGFNDPYGLWTFKSADEPSKPRNAISLVIRLDYGDHSIIYGGDAVGKLKNSETCVYTEKYLLEKVKPELLDADIIIAPHHGADNGSCDEFIKAVTPKYVIFPAGSEHGHPRLTTVNRYLANGVKAANMFRTDRGDDEKQYGKYEWAEGRVSGCIDLPFDDDISITLAKGTEPVVFYLNPTACECEAKKRDEH